MSLSGVVFVVLLILAIVGVIGWAWLWIPALAFLVGVILQLVMLAVAGAREW